MARRFRCKYTELHRCKKEATQRLRLTFSIVSIPQFTRVCEAHAVALKSVCEVASIGYERV